MPYNSAFTASTFAREGKKRATYLTEFEKDLVSICNQQANSGGKRFKWHFFFIQDFDVAHPSSESDIDYLILSKFNSAWKKKLAVLLESAPARSGICKGKCWVSSLEGKPGDDKFYISIAGGISQVVIDDRKNPTTASINKATIVKALRKEWLKRLKIKVGEAEVAEIDEHDVDFSGDHNEPESEDQSTENGASTTKRQNTNEVKQKIKDFKSVSVDDEIEQIKKLIDLQEATDTLPKTDEFRTKVQASIDKNFKEIEDEVAHETQQVYTQFQHEEMAGDFEDDYDSAKEEIKALRASHDEWKEVVSLMEKSPAISSCWNWV